jgi:hypothetical protein
MNVILQCFVGIAAKCDLQKQKLFFGLKTAKNKQNEVVSKNIFLRLFSSRNVRRPKSRIGPSSEASHSTRRTHRQRMVARCSLPTSSEHLLHRKLSPDTPHVLAVPADNFFEDFSGIFRTSDNRV